jgi:lysosomal acid lipase/cholesteryl ester hydrolase
MFDFDTTENMKRYGTPTPPNYDVNKLKQFTIPKYFFIGTKDVICDEIDVQKLV